MSFGLTFSRWSLLVCAGLCAGVCTQAARAQDVQTQAVPAPAAKKTADDKKAATPASLETLKLPSGAIMVICREIGEALQLAPRAVVLSVEEYQKLLDQLEQARRQAK